MPERPCLLKHPLPVPEQCHWCDLFVYDPRYNRLWGGSGVRAAVARRPPSCQQQRLPCVHLGADTGERRQCGSCRGKVSLKVFACAHPAHGKTTVPDCARCPDYTPPPVEPVRNLLYHCFPVRGNGVWQWNLDQLRKRWHVFTGQKVISVVRDERCDSLAAVQDYLGLPDVTWLDKRNQPALGEVWSWPDLWAALDGRPGLTFYAHAKGVTRPTDESVGVRGWADVMYQAALDYVPLVEKLLQEHPIAGSFKQNACKPWHYSGTFYWVRTTEGLAKHALIHQGWCGTEFWPGIAFQPEEGAVLFRQNRLSNLRLYAGDYVRTVTEPAFRRWQAANERFATTRAT